VRTFFLAASGLSTSGVYCGNDYDAVTTTRRGAK
jgi:hypothetical protein